MEETSKSKTRTVQLISAKEFAKMVSLSKRQIFRMNSTRLIPKPLKISGSFRWRLSDVEQWLECDCPDRKTFEAMKQTREMNIDNHKQRDS